ncbi:hypothetical protein RJ45_21940 [Photobacterium gaetbulicola]|uniref:Serine acetyltransferase n=1 Tax=Photobacterium gaetbulicola TaxID=1295392 RepID=A0A0B9FYE5_9GAMM|nr:hypothetical protein [Photobacterium gaetbulicola]KHT61578.1 hypothetical protein RJ45_21940 [Photobacterium gaetbulicola]
MEFKKFKLFLKEDLRVFKLVFGSGILSSLYFPAFRVVFIFRLSQFFYSKRLLRPLSYLLTNINDLLHGVWISPRVEIGKGFLPSHPRGIIINPDTVIGEYCSLMQNVTIGGEKIIIGDYVEILSGAQIINDKNHNQKLFVENEAVIAAGAIVLSSVKANSVMAGVPAVQKKLRSSGEHWLQYRENQVENG